MRDMHLVSASGDPTRVFKITLPGLTWSAGGCVVVNGPICLLTPKQARAAAQRLIEFAEFYEKSQTNVTPEVIEP